MHADATAALLAVAALGAGHHWGDRWMQTDHQAVTKGQCGHRGRAACAGHVASLTATQAVLLVLVLAATGTAVDPAAAALGLAVNAASHYWADRRFTLRGLVLATEPLTAKRGYYEHGGGAEPMDQAWHRVWIIPAALTVAAPLGLAVAITGICAAVLGALDALARRGLRTEDRTAA